MAARCGASNAIHRVRNFSIAEAGELPLTPVPDVENFKLFSWGNRVWATWKYNTEYQTKVEYNLDEEWINVLGEDANVEEGKSEI